jgi:ribonuclease P protein component
MLSRSKRLSRAVFDSKPTSRGRFAYGSISFFKDRQGVAIVVSKKVAKTAVVRNKIRRRVAHALKDSFKNLAHAAVIYPTREAATAPYEDLRAALAAALKSR